MTDEEVMNTNDSELMMLYHEDDEDAKNLLYYKYRFIIDILVKKYNPVLTSLGIDYQEIYSECSVGFSDGLKSFQEDKDASLPTFITLCIERRLCNLYRKYTRDKYKGMQETYSLDFIYDDVDTRLIDLISDVKHDPLKNITEEEEFNELLSKIKETLSSSEYEVFELKARNLNYLEIAKILNKNPKQVDNTIQRIKTKIKNILDNIES